MLLKFFRLTLIFVWIIPCVLIAVLHSLFYPFNPAPIYTFAVLWGPLSAKILGLEYELRDHDRLVNARPCILIANHQSNYDLLMACLFRVRRTVSLGKKELGYIPFFGLFYWLSGNIMVDRSNKKKAKASMDKVKDIIRRKGYSILIMPEGTRSKGRGLLPFKKGAFITAIHAQVPIVPIVISDWYQHIDFKRWRAGKVIIQILPKVDVSAYKESEAEALSQHCRQLMEAQLKSVNLELAKKA
jgi:1-acyl-sn-glycerol-3-phosphate acyltransferase